MDSKRAVDSLRSPLLFVSVLLCFLIHPSSALPLDPVALNSGACPLPAWGLIFGIGLGLLLLSVYVERGDLFASALSLPFFIAALYTLPLTSETSYAVVGVWNATLNQTLDAIQPVVTTPDLTWLFFLCLGLFALATLRTVEAILRMIRNTEQAENRRRWW